MQTGNSDERRDIKPNTIKIKEPVLLLTIKDKEYDRAEIPTKQPESTQGSREEESVTQPELRETPTSLTPVNILLFAQKPNTRKLR